MPFKTCRYCSQNIPSDANFCPYCTRPTGSRLWFWLRSNAAGMIVGALLMGLLFLVSRTDLFANPGIDPTLPPSSSPTFPTLTPVIDISNVRTYAPPSTRTPLPIDIVTRESLKDDMVQLYIPAGEFNMGFENGDDNEKPIHTVYLNEYWIDQTEVTNTQYALCVAAGHCTKPLNLESQINSWYQDEELSDHPVVFVDWNQANAYCTWAGRRLPTEAEWEKAARGSDGRLYPWGDEFDSTKVNYCDVNCWAIWKDVDNSDGYSNTSPVGAFPGGASPYGVLDMAGNAYEWVSDWFSLYTSKYQDNPTGPASGKEHVLRGGAWGDDFHHLLTVIRSDEPSDVRRDFIGFRCAE